MAIVLTDVKHKTGPNPGGVVNLYVALAEDVTNIPEPVNGEITTDITVSGAGFKKFEFAPGKCKLSHPTVGEPGSKSQETLIDLTIAGDDPADLALFESMLNGKFICIVDNASGKMKVAGSKRAPLILEQASYDSGEDQPGMNGTVFQLKGRGGKNAPGYTGVIPEPAAVV